MENMLPCLLMVGLFSGLPTGYTQLVKGPPTISGFLGRSLSVRCQYSMGYQNYVKYWCKGAEWNYCTTVLKTDKSEREVTAGRTTIKDNHAHPEFVVTLHNLTENDTGSYWCIIERTGSDSGFLIDITVVPEPTTTVATTSFPTDSTSVSHEERPPQTLSLLILLPIIFLVLLAILAIALLVMWILKRKKAAKAHEDVMLATAPRPSEATIPGATMKAPLRPHGETSVSYPDQAANNTEVKYASVTRVPTYLSQPQAPTATGEVSYAALRFSTLEEEPTYANMK